MKNVVILDTCEYEALQERVRRCGDALIIAQNVAREAEQQARSWSEKFHEQCKRSDAFEKELNKSKDELAIARSEADEWKSHLREARKEPDALKTGLAIYSKRIAELESNLSRAQEAFVTVQQARDDYKAKNAKLNAELDRANGEVERLRKAVFSAQQDLRVARLELEHTQKDLAKANETNGRLMCKCSELEQKLEVEKKGSSDALRVTMEERDRW